MAVCARGSVLVFYVVFAGGQLFGKKNNNKIWVGPFFRVGRG